MRIHSLMAGMNESNIPNAKIAKTASSNQSDDRGEDLGPSTSNDRPESLGIQKERIVSGRRYLDTSEEAVADAAPSEALPSVSVADKNASPAGDMVSFVAEDIQERLRRCSMPQSTESAGSSSTSARSAPSPYPPLLPDPRVLDELETQAKQIAMQIDRILQEFRGGLSGMTELTVECVNTYSSSIRKTCDSVDGSIKSMYQLMAKVEELLEVSKGLPPLAKQIEIKRVLDLFEAHLQK